MNPARFSSRVMLALCFVAAGLGADCKVGREVVGRRRTQPVDPQFCLPAKSCDEDEVEDAVELLPEFVAARVCSEGECPSRALSELPARAAVASFEHLILEAAEPSVLVLEDVDFDNVLLELVGPVRLRLRADSRLHLVHILLRDQGGTPQLVLEEAELLEVFASSEAASLSGELILERSTVARSELSARSLELSSTLVDNSRLRAIRGIVGHGRIKYAELEFETGWVAGGDFYDVRTTGCGSLTLSGTRAYGARSRFGPCPDVLYLFLSELGDADLDGPIHAEDSLLTQPRVGMRADTTLDLFTAEVRYPTFCPRTNGVTVGEATLVTCAYCEELGEALPVCTFGDLPLRLRDNICPAFNPEPELCEPPWPARARPNAYD